ncbi:hypothetical protein ZWY2020_052446 [Hordeum vulgare]|nr:hypothetical protein ZWY2020_052446 [Hordeum vulgare]
MVPDQVSGYQFKRRNKVLRFERDSKEYEEKEKLRRAADSVKSTKFGKAKQHGLEKKSPSSVAEKGGTPRQNPRVSCMEKNLGKRTIETVADYLKWKHPYVNDEAESNDDDFVLADFVRNAQSPAIRKDYDTSKGQFRLGRVRAMVEKMYYFAMAEMDFCQLVVDELQLAVVKW